MRLAVLRPFARLARSSFLSGPAVACVVACGGVAGCDSDVATSGESGALGSDDAAADATLGDADDVRTSDPDVAADVAPDAAPDIAVKDTGPEDTGPFVMAKHTNPPKVPYLGGGLLKSPQLITVTFPNDPYAKDFQSFAAQLGPSEYWATVTKGLCETSGTANCIGPAVDAGHVELKTAPAKSYTDSTDPKIASSLQDFIKANLDSGALPPPPQDALYIFYFPKSTKITLDSGGGQTDKSCYDFGGYHHFTTWQGKNVAYAIVPECNGGMGMDTLTSCTVASSHEIVEAVTDPYTTVSQTGYVGGYMMTPVVPVQASWYITMHGGELGDLCLDLFGHGDDQWNVGPYTVQRSWTNVAAQAGHDPCQPAPAGEVYFAVSPDKNKGVGLLDVGDTVSFTATAFSDGPTEPWVLSGVDASSYGGMPGGSQYLSITFNDNQDQVIVQNGDSVTVNVTMVADPGPYNFGAPGMLISTNKIGTKSHIWPVWFYTTAEMKNGI